MVVGSKSYLMLAIREETQVKCLLGVRQQLAPSVEHRLLHVYYGTAHAAIVGYNPLVVFQLGMQR